MTIAEAKQAQEAADHVIAFRRGGRAKFVGHGAEAAMQVLGITNKVPGGTIQEFDANYTKAITALVRQGWRVAVVAA